VREVFDLFDFWDGRDGLVDGFKVGDFLRCCGLNPTQAAVFSNGGMKKLGKRLSRAVYIKRNARSVRNEHATNAANVADATARTQ